MAAGGRRSGRERALSLLYEAEAKDMAPADVLAALPVPPDRFVTRLVEGVGERRDELDALILRHAVGWPLERMPVVDRNLLRMAAFELSDRPDTPVAVVISEAVELAREFSTEESPRFVNGVLSAVAKDLGRD